MRDRSGGWNVPPGGVGVTHRLFSVFLARSLAGTRDPCQPGRMLAAMNAERLLRGLGRYLEVWLAAGIFVPSSL